MSIKNTLLCLALAAALTACGSGDNASAPLVGKFIDSPVGGIGYRTETRSGFTNVAGEFEYLANENVTFFVGSVELPAARAVAVLTPLDLANTRDTSNRVVTNILVLLQSLDEDGDPTNGITIPSTAARHATQAIDFDVPVTAFLSDASITTLVANAGGMNTTPVSGQAALAHFNGTIQDQGINVQPIAQAGAAQNVSQGATVTLDGSASSDANGDALTYAWTITTKPQGSNASLSSASAVKPVFEADSVGDYVLSLTVNDGALDSAAATVSVTAAATNSAPVANAGATQNVATGVTVTLDGSASSDADADTLTYAWTVTTKPQGSSASLSDASAAKPTFTADVSGDYAFSLTVNDGTVSSTATTVSVTAAAPSVSVAATVVDPYIEGAVFCVDTNRNKVCDTGEPRSSASTAGGSISFNLEAALPADSLIVADTTSLGTHNGAAFALPMSALVGQGADGFVISPMTALRGASVSVSNGQVNEALTNQDIADLLTTAGLTGVLASDITADPMQNISTFSGSISDADLVRIRAALSAYGYMRLFTASNTLRALTPSQVKISGALNGGAVYEILSTMVGAIKAVVSPGLVAQAQGSIDVANGQLAALSISLPAVTAEVIVKAGVAILDRVVGDATDACNAAAGDYTAGLTTANQLLQNAGFSSLVGNLGLAYYGAHNKTALQTAKQYLTSVPTLVEGIDCASGHFSVASNLSYQCIN